MEKIIKGTTPTLEIEFDLEEANVLDFDDAVLTVESGKTVKIIPFERLKVSSEENSVVYKFSQEETLRFDGKYVNFQLDVTMNRNRYRAFTRSYDVISTNNKGVM